MRRSWSKLAREVFLIRFGFDVGAAGDSTAKFLEAISSLEPDDEGIGFDTKFFKDVSQFANSFEEAKVSPTTISNLFSKTKPQGTITSKTSQFISNYLSWILSNGLVSGNSIDRCNVLIGELRGQEPRDEPDQPEVTSYKSRFVKSHIFEVIARNSIESIEEQTIFCNNIFRNRLFNNDYDNAAYFLAFRQSTIPDRIVKSFLVILTPAENKLGFFSYFHMVKGSALNDITKVSRGVISHMSPATYFIGTIRRSDYDHASNYEVISFERDTFIAKAPVLFGLVMTSAAVNQPIISRFALLRIGDRRTLGRKLSDKDITPTEINAEDLEDNIYRLFEDIPDGFAHIRTTEPRAAGIAALIKEGIQNIARVDILSKKVEQGIPSCLGALETWGVGPRP